MGAGANLGAPIAPCATCIGKFGTDTWFRSHLRAKAQADAGWICVTPCANRRQVLGHRHLQARVP
jgi:hypothetical protein